jgi:predicted nucleotidyltransferase
MILQELIQKGLCNPPKWLPTNCAYLTIIGSTAYGTSSDSSDLDIYGFCIPSRETLFPHLVGEIPGFGKQRERFGQWSEHHIYDASAMGGHGREYDFTIYNIVKYFQLAMENNPTMIGSLFTPANCVLHATHVGNMVRENRKLFLHKGCFSKYKGYGYSQLHKMSTKQPIGKRKEDVDRVGYDSKYAMHLIRLLNEVEQILMEGDIDIQRNREELKAIRRGEWTEEYLRQVAAERERGLEEVYKKSTLRQNPDEPAIRQLLLDCLEHHYGSLEKCVVNPDQAVQALRNIQAEIEKVQSLIAS